MIPVGQSQRLKDERWADWPSSLSFWKFSSFLFIVWASWVVQHERHGGTLTAFVVMHECVLVQRRKEHSFFLRPSLLTGAVFLKLPEPSILGAGLAVGGAGHDGSHDGYYVVFLLKNKKCIQLRFPIKKVITLVAREDVCANTNL